MENKLPIEFKTKWLAALRSGEYKQCKHTLHDYEGGHCCLGVAEIISGVESDSKNILLGNFPAAIIGSAVHNINVSTLTEGMNDRGKSFLEIADWIEANL